MNYSLQRKIIAYRQEIPIMFKLALPIIFGQLGIMLMGVADTIQVGHIASDAKFALDAAGAAHSVWITIAIFGLNALGMGAPLISKAHAEDNTVEVARLFRACIRVALWASLACGGILLLLAYNFHIFKQQTKVANLAVPFLYIIILSLVPQFLFVAIRQLSDGLSHTRVAMTITLTAVLLNIVLNYFLINGIWVFPQWGLNGSGVATLISRCYMAVTLYWYVSKQAMFAPYLVPIKTSVNDLVNKMIRLGIPTGLQGFFEIAVFAIAQLMLGWINEDQQAAHLIAISPAACTFMMVTGIAAAGGIRVGAALGHHSRANVLMSGTIALVMGGTLMAASSIIFLIFGHDIVALYIQDQTVAPIAATLLTMAGMFQMADGIQAVSLGILRGISDVNIPTGITLLSYWLIGLPIGYYLAFNQKMEALGLWIGLSAGLTAAAILLSYRFYHRAKRMII
jgi:multidrug resistance protein, MATE family